MEQHGRDRHRLPDVTRGNMQSTADCLAGMRTSRRVRRSAFAKLSGTGVGAPTTRPAPFPPTRAGS